MKAALAQARWPVLLLLGLFMAQGLYLIQDTSPTTDETAFHMVNGYTYLKTHDYRMSPANPALIRQWMALPWLVINPKLDLSKPSWLEADSVPFSLEVFYKDNRAIADKLLYSARFMILILGAALGWVIYRWAADLYGGAGGLLSLSLYAFCPSLIAHASIAHTDIGVTLFCALSAYFLWRYLENSNQLDLFGFSLSFAFACAAKYNALVLGPAFLLVVLIRRGFLKFLWVGIMTAAIAFLIVWSSYFFEFRPLLWEGVPRIEEKIGYIASISNFLFPGSEAARQSLQTAAQTIPIPMPSYILGIAGIARSHHSPYLHYAFGEWTTKGHWYYYLFSFAVKMTLPFLCLLLARFIFFKKASSKTSNENWVILLPAAVYFYTTFSDSTGVGVRYLFPILPPLLVWVGGLANLASASRAWKGLITGFVILNAASALAVFPDYLSYFNESVGGVKGGYRYVRGSDVDWGQGLKGLKRYIDKEGIESISLQYFGSADPSFYGIRYEPISDTEKESPQKKVYAVSLFSLESVDWVPQTKPTALVKGSIFLYDFRKSLPNAS